MPPPYRHISILWVCIGKCVHSFTLFKIILLSLHKELKHLYTNGNYRISYHRKEELEFY